MMITLSLLYYILYSILFHCFVIQEKNDCIIRNVLLC